MSRKALVIGINDYTSCPLRGCVNDATEVFKLLQHNADGSPNFGVNLNTSIKTRSELSTAVSQLFSGTDDIALLYFSGHGYINELGGFIVTPDHSKYDEGVSMNDILQWANRSKCKNKIIIFDCCHAGAMGTEPSNITDASSIGAGLTVLTASGQHESAIEINGHGVFTNLLLTALEGGAADLKGEVSPGGIYAYIDKALAEWEQRPMFKTNISSFVSLRSTDPPIPQQVIRYIANLFPNRDDEYQLNPSYEFTNTPEGQPQNPVEPYATPDHVRIFKELQLLERVGLIVPVGEEHMYFAAMNKKSCKLTPIGQHYWNLVNKNRF
ncbi:MAG: caspase family protein [Oscillospiraceae bacterium]|nr:caspase family protein [Oscillospiraceae bacterium]